ncbi:MAG: hypothetical protein A2X53_04990 [Candidatus Rokubacteria bacterium GWA2_70_23]|nr:MAG: hypothetical protein A2X53_04990 [Candidatus Rokubacteria bacterium GWA2_70_23]
MISLRDFFPKFLVFSSSDSVFWTRSAIVRIFAVLRQLEARTESSSSSTLRKRCSLSSTRAGGSAPSSPRCSSSGWACGKSTRRENWSCRIREASATAASGVTLPLVQMSITSRSSVPPGTASVWKLTRLTGEKSESTSMALMGSASISRRSAAWYPRPRSTHSSISRLPSLSSVASLTSGVRTSTSASGSKCPAVTVRGPWALSRRIFGRFTCRAKTTFRRFRMMSRMSSFTPWR